MTDLNGKTALVTGSTSGVDKARATAFGSRNSPAYLLIEVQGIDMDVRFSLLNGLPTSTRNEGDSE
jgi:hypothetical protein